MASDGDVLPVCLSDGAAIKFPLQKLTDSMTQQTRGVGAMASGGV